MNIEVIINHVKVQEHPIEFWELEFVSNHLEGKYQFELLRSCGIECEIAVTGVQSRMNSKFFKEQPAEYDHIIQNAAYENSSMDVTNTAVV